MFMSMSNIPLLRQAIKLDLDDLNKKEEQIS